MEQFIQELLRWNKAHNLISKNEITNIDEHLQDSLSVIPFIKDIQYRQIIDIGSGNGFPVIPLAIWAKENDPSLKFIATDVVEKKLSFLKWCWMKFELNMDVEDMNKKKVFEEPSLIISRAFSSVKNILEWRDRHAPNSKEFLLLKGADVYAELEESNIFEYELEESTRGFLVSFTG